MDKSAKDLCGAGLKRVCELADIPPVLHMGSCVDISRMMILAAELAKDAGLQINQLPVVGCAPEWMSEKAVSIGNYVLIHSLALIHMFPVLQKWESFLQREQENGQELLIQ